MIEQNKIVVVMPAYNASTTLKKTFEEIPFKIVDEVILVDDASRDNTVSIAKALLVQHVITHSENKGYGANQKTCYKKALEQKADIIVMLHPDYQYTPLLIEAMVYPIVRGVYDVMLGVRTLGRGPLAGGMPLYKFLGNRFLTWFQNLMLNRRLAEYHTGYRAYRREVLEKINFEQNSDDFIFDNQMLSQIIYAGFEIGEISCPAKYFKEASKIKFKKGLYYGFGVMKVSLRHRLHKWNIKKTRILEGL
ncbi:MAG: glycosyltransferase family 2 protein [Microscillaceae bacterium]|nr:glycosyltransferase family 2 protein [Microscillaceae bacterium]